MIAYGFYDHFYGKRVYLICLICYTSLWFMQWIRYGTINKLTHKHMDAEYVKHTFI